MLAGGAPVLSYIAVVLLFEPAADFRLNAVLSTLGGASYFIFLLGSALGCVGFACAFRRFGHLRPLAYLGRNSMLFYAVHWIVLRHSRILIVHFCPDLPKPCLALLLLAILTACLALLALKKHLLPKVLLGE